VGLATKNNRTHYRQTVIKLVEKQFARQPWHTSTAIYASGATDDDIAFWGRHFGSCRRGVLGYVVVRKGEQKCVL